MADRHSRGRYVRLPDARQLRHVVGMLAWADSLSAPGCAGEIGGTRVGWQAAVGELDDDRQRQ